MSSSIQLSFLASAIGQGSQIGQTLVNGRALAPAASGVNGFSQLLAQHLGGTGVNFSQSGQQSLVDTELAGLAAPGKLLPAAGNSLPLSATTGEGIDLATINLRASGKIGEELSENAAVNTTHAARTGANAALNGGVTSLKEQTSTATDSGLLGRELPAAISSSELGSSTVLDGLDSVSFELQAISLAVSDGDRPLALPEAEQGLSVQKAVGLQSSDAHRLSALRSSRSAAPAPLNDNGGYPHRAATELVAGMAQNQSALGRFAPLTGQQVRNAEPGVAPSLEQASSANRTTGPDTSRTREGSLASITQAGSATLSSALAGTTVPLLTATSLTSTPLTATAIAALASASTELQALSPAATLAPSPTLTATVPASGVNSGLTASSPLQKDSLELITQALGRGRSATSYSTKNSTTNSTTNSTENSAENSAESSVGKSVGKSASGERRNEQNPLASGLAPSSGSTVSQPPLTSSLRSLSLSEHDIQSGQTIGSRLSGAVTDLSARESAALTVRSDNQVSLNKGASSSTSAEQARAALQQLQQGAAPGQPAHLGEQATTKAAQVPVATTNASAAIGASAVADQSPLKASSVAPQAAEAVTTVTHNKGHNSAETVSKTQVSAYSNEEAVRELQSGQATVQTARGASTTNLANTAPVPTAIANPVNTAATQSLLLPQHRQSAYSLSLDKSVSLDTGSSESSHLLRSAETSLEGIARPITTPAAVNPQFGSSALNSADPLSSSFALNLAQAQSKFANSIPQIGQRIQWMLGSGAQAAEIQIDPPELGPLQIQVSSDDKQTSVSFVAHNSAARELIEANLPRLREHLESLGLELGDASVDQQEQQTASDSQFAEGQTAIDGDKAGVDASDSGTESGTPQSSGVKSGIDAYV